MIKLPEENVSCPQGKPIMVSGWGRTWVRNKRASYKSRFLMTTELSCLDHDHCKVLNKFKKFGAIYENNTICTGNLQHNNTGTWKGDSGGSYISVF